jgi:hypothetical protein
LKAFPGGDLFPRQGFHLYDLLIDDVRDKHRFGGAVQERGLERVAT